MSKRFDSSIRLLLSILTLLLACISACAGESVRYTWFPGGLLKSVSLGRGGDVGFVYTEDGARDLSAVNYPQVGSHGAYFAALTENFTRYPSGEMDEVRDQAGTRKFSYTKGRVTKVDWLTGVFSGWRLERVFGVDGRQVSASLFDAQGAAVHSTGFSYENGNLDTVTGNGSTADYGRDAQSLLVTGWSRDGASGGALTDSRSFGAGGRLTGISGNVAGVPSFSYADFDSSGRRKRTVTDGFGWDYDYDSHGHLTKADHPTLGMFVYGVNGLGVRDSARGWAMAGNALNQPTQLAHATSYKLLLCAHAESRIWVNGIEVVNPNGAPFEHEVQVSGVGADGGYFQYLIEASRAGAGDATPGGGNATARAAVKGFAYVPPGVENFKHDADGNREESARWKYFWDGRNRLVKAETKGFDPVAGEQDGASVSFDYDSEGRRFKKTVVRRFWDKNTWKTEEKTCWFLYDGWSLVYERQEPGIRSTMGTVAATLERSYTHGLDLSGSRGGAGGAGGVLNYRETKNGQSELYFPFYDGGGNVVSLVRGSDRKVVASYRYGPFGEMIKAEGEMAENNPLRFATQYFDPETGLNYFGMRYFDSTTGSWLSREPLGEAESLNLYAYCGHDPVNFLDFLGMAAIAITEDQAVLKRVEWLAAALQNGSYVPGMGPSEGQTRTYGEGFGLREAYNDEDFANLLAIVDAELEKVAAAENANSPQISALPDDYKAPPAPWYAGKTDQELAAASYALQPLRIGANGADWAPTDRNGYIRSINMSSANGQIMIEGVAFEYAALKAYKALRIGGRALARGAAVANKFRPIGAASARANAFAGNMQIVMSGGFKNLMSTQTNLRNMGMSVAFRNTVAKGRMMVGAKTTRLDYSGGFTDDLVNFNQGATRFSGKLDDDLLIVSYHGDVPLGHGRSAKWWTTPGQGNSFSTLDEVMKGLALPPDWGARNVVSVARIPKGTHVDYYFGTARRQLSKTGEVFPGNGLQFRFREFDPAWILHTKKLP